MAQRTGEQIDLVPVIEPEALFEGQIVHVMLHDLDYMIRETQKVNVYHSIHRKRCYLNNDKAQLRRPQSAAPVSKTKGSSASVYREIKARVVEYIVVGRGKEKSPYSSMVGVSKISPPQYAPQPSSCAEAHLMTLLKPSS